MLRKVRIGFVVLLIISCMLIGRLMCHYDGLYEVYDRERTQGVLLTRLINHSTHGVKSVNQPLILMWYHPFNNPGYGPTRGEHCGCKYTYNRSFAVKSDAIVFYCMDSDSNDLPLQRNLKQKYVWWCREPPTHIKYRNIDIQYPLDFFNWTMTYRRDSSVPTPYGYTSDVMENVRKENRSLKDILREKDKVAICIVSNCKESFHGPQARIRLIKELNETGLEVEMFGRCFQDSKKASDEEISKVAKRSKFFLSFENSYHCKDYITEKFWVKAIGNGVVPVVWGGRREDYEAVAPKSSFIFAEDFETPEKLANYLIYLNRNNSAYMEYLRWRTYTNTDKVLDVPARNPNIFFDFNNACELCRHLLKRRDANDVTASVVHSIEKYFYDVSDDCLRSPSANESYWRYGGKG